MSVISSLLFSTSSSTSVSFFLLKNSLFLIFSFREEILLSFLPLIFLAIKAPIPPNAAAAAVNFAPTALYRDKAPAFPKKVYVPALVNSNNPTPTCSKLILK